MSANSEGLGAPVYVPDLPDRETLGTVILPLPDMANWVKLILPLVGVITPSPAH